MVLIERVNVHGRPTLACDYSGQQGLDHDRIHAVVRPFQKQGVVVRAVIWPSRAPHRSVCLRCCHALLAEGESSADRQILVWRALGSVQKLIPILLEGIWLAGEAIAA